jgi:uncharacterized protein (DUF1684 family)
VAVKRIFPLCLILGMTALAAVAPDAAYLESINKWKVEEAEDLKQNWLPLAGLFWLKAGVNTFGSSTENGVVFPKGAARAGEFDLAGEDVTARFLPESQARIDGKGASAAKLDPDVSGHPTVVEMGSLRFFVIVRGKRVGIRLQDMDAASVRNFRGMVFFPVDLTYRVSARWMPSDGKATIAVPNVLGDVTQVPVTGVLVFDIGGKEVRLTPTGGSPQAGLSFVFNDLTAKTDTYPGGRFLESEPAKDGVVVLDFNRAYNPPCAVTPFATCPLAPKDNRLGVAIPAGEKFDHAAHGHS